MIKRLIAMLAATALLAGSIVFYYHKTGTRTDGVYYEATGIRPDAAILTVNGDAVSAEEYFYWLDSVCEYLASSLNAVPAFSAALTEDSGVERSVRIVHQRVVEDMRHGVGIYSDAG